jgi:hypothetical protein
MDSINRFESPGTFFLVRLEYLCALVVCVTIAIAHMDEIRWVPFITLFAYIDVIGYLPGAIAYRRRGGAQLPRIYYILYNTTHNFVFNGLLVALWWTFIGPEWSLLAIPIHLFGDRSLFGNSLKPFDVSFEPHMHPAFAQFEQEFKRGAMS